MTRKLALLVPLCAVPLGMAGCANRHIVRAAPPSVSTPPPQEITPMPVPDAPPPVDNTTVEPAPEVPTPELPPSPVKKPVAPKPRPAPTDTAEPAPQKPAPPQISPALSPGDLQRAKDTTTTNITTAEQNLQVANGKVLSVAQKDLVEKISGFLGQAHEAIRADDWVRAQNLAEKARLLSAELVKSF
jgi:outer membrane biosynthesis protein TonB